MSRWFRFYSEALDDPKVQLLPDDQFKMWVNLLCFAAKNEGKIYVTEAVAFSLHVTLPVLENYVKALWSVMLIDRCGEVGGTYEPHNWEKRQYKSDTSNERVRRHRDRQRNVTETPPDYRLQKDSSSTSEPLLPREGIKEVSIERRGQASPSVANLPTEPSEIYDEASLQGFAFEFDGMDVPQAIRELAHWTNRKGTTDPIERMNMIYGGLQKRHGRFKLQASLKAPEAAQVSSQLATSRLAQRRTA